MSSTSWSWSWVTFTRRKRGRGCRRPSSVTASRSRALAAASGRWPRPGGGAPGAKRGRPGRGEVVAKAKITPLAIASATMMEVERVARGAGVLAVTPFKSLTLGALARESLDDKQRQRFETGLREEIDWFGSRAPPSPLPGRSAPSAAKEP